MPGSSIYKLDWSRINLRGGLTTVVVVIAVALILIVFGVLGIAVGVAALFVMIADQPGTLRYRVSGVLRFTLLGSLLAFGGAWAGTSHLLIASLLMFVIVYLATVAVALGKPAAVRGLLLAIWSVLALSLSGSVEAPLDLAGAFLVGGVLAGLVVLAHGLITDVGESADQPERRLIAGLVEQVRTPLGRFAVVRGAASGVATYLGILLFPDYPIWAVISVIVILREEREATVSVGVLRTVGTLLGVALTSLVLMAIGDSQTVVTIAFLAAGFLMMALQKVNYAVFTLFLTAMLVLALHVEGSDAVEGGLARFLATLLGAGIAFVALWAGSRTRTSQ